MKKVFICFICFLISNVMILKAQSHFYKKILGLTISYEVKTRATPDGGWITGGTSSGVKLMKFDKCGQLEWSQHFTGNIDFVDIIVSSFGGYAVTGYSGTIPFGADTYLLRLDANGNIIYSKEYQALSSEYTYSLGEDSNGNFFINGNTTDSGTGLSNNFIIKTDSLGTILWSNLYATGGMWARAIVCSDGGVLRCGGLSDIYKVDPSGAVSWAKEGYWHARHEPVEINDGYVFPSYSSLRGYVFKTDLNGNLLWCTSQYLTSYYPIQRMAETPTGNVIVVNNSSVTEFDHDGKYVDHNHFADTSAGTTPTLTDICLLKDHSFVVSGFQTGQVFNARIDSLLHTGCADKIVALDTIPALVMTISNVSYSPIPKFFNTVNIPIAAANFTLIEDLVCATYDSLVLTTSLPDTTCSGESQIISFTDQSTGDFAWNWYEGNCGGTPIGTGLFVNVAPETTQTYFIGAKGCDTTVCIPLTVNVLNKPFADFETEYKIDCKGVHVDLTNLSTDANSYIWNLNGHTETETDASYDLGFNSSFTFSLIAINNNLCKDTIIQQYNLNAFQNYLNLTVPNVFTPNNDGLNDELGTITNTDLSDCFSISIFDRWGLEMFSSKSILEKWDGRTNSGKKAPQGTYFYVLEINDLAYKGQITLLE